MELMLLPEVQAERPRPVYRQWWFWTVGGAVVAGAVVGIVYGATHHLVQDRGGAIFCESGSCP